MSEFPGWEPPLENWSKLPHQFVNLMPDMSLAEMKVTLYLLRHTWGWGNYTGFQGMTVDEFMNGRLMGRERIDRGTGLSKSSVINGLRSAVDRKTVEAEIDDSDKARIKKQYRLRSIIGPTTGSKKKTAEVQNLDPDLNKETSKESSSPPAAERPSTERERFSLAMEERFANSSGIPRPDLSTAKAKRKAGVLWYSPLWAVYKLFRPEGERAGGEKLAYDPRSLSQALDLIDKAVKHCREEKLTISSPRSIENVAISLFASGTHDTGEASIEFWKQYV